MTLWCKHSADAQTVNIDWFPHCAEALLEARADALHAYFGGGVDVHGLCWRGFCDGEVREGSVPFGVGDAVDRDGGGEDEFFDAQFAGCFYDGVGAEGVDAEGFVVGDAVWLRDAWGVLVGGRGIVIEIC